MIKEAVRIRVLQLLDTEKKLVIKETISELGFAIAGYREEVDFILRTLEEELLLKDCSILEESRLAFHCWIWRRSRFVRRSLGEECVQLDIKDCRFLLAIAGYVC